MKEILPTQLKPKSRKFVFAIWEIKTLPDDLDEFHISCGTDDDSQAIGYFLDDKDAKLLIESITGQQDVNYRVMLFAPSCDLQQHENYWLSPSLVGDQEAIDFGITNCSKLIKI